MKMWSQKTRQTFLSYLWSIGFWMVLAILMTWQQHVIEGIEHHGSQTFFQSLLLRSIRFFTFGLLTPPIFNLVRRFPISRDKLIRRSVIYLLGAVPFVILYVCIRWSLAPAWDLHGQKFLPRSLEGFKGLFTGTLSDQVGVYIALVIAAHAYEYFNRSRNQELEQVELRQALAASELQTLKSQLHPHFLFNTLHGISTLMDTDRVQAKAMVVQLSNLLRAALQHGSADLISFDEEIEFLESYLDLEKMRLGNRLKVHWNLDPETFQMLVPQLILQPLVENAILHGISSCRKGGWVAIESEGRDKMIVIRIRNSVGGRTEGGMGLGLQNAKSRVKYLYSEEAKFSFELADDQIATATLVFPAFPAPQQDMRKVPVLQRNE